MQISPEEYVRIALGITREDMMEEVRRNPVMKPLLDLVIRQQERIFELELFLSRNNFDGLEGGERHILDEDWASVKEGDVPVDITKEIPAKPTTSFVEQFPLLAKRTHHFDLRELVNIEESADYIQERFDSFMKEIERDVRECCLDRERVKKAIVESSMNQEEKRIVLNDLGFDIYETGKDRPEDD